MNKKYELTTDTVDQNYMPLYRIRALIDVGCSVKAGDLGGYIQSEENLSQEGEAWVGGNARVYDNAQVTDNAQVMDRARVFENALICDYAIVYDDAQVHGSSQIMDMAQVRENAKVRGHACVNGQAHIANHARVGGNAQLFDNALICGRAMVFEHARIYDDARVYGDVTIGGRACVHNKATLRGEIQLMGNALIRHTWDHLLLGPARSSGRFTTAHDDSEIGVRVNCGCFSGTVEEFKARIEKEHKYSPEALKQYRLFASLIEENFKNETI